MPLIPKNCYTLLDDNQWHQLHVMADRVENLAGEIAEVGVYQGGSALFFCQRFPTQQIILIDTFEGLPDLPRSNLDAIPTGTFSCGLETVKQRLPANAKLYKQVYAPGNADPLEGLSLRLLHLDCDLSASASYALQQNWARMVPKGIILIDDYNAPECRGLQEVVNTFCAQERLRLQLASNTTQAWLVKHPQC